MSMDPSRFLEKGYQFSHVAPDVGMDVITKGSAKFYAEYIELDRRDLEHSRQRLAKLKTINHKNVVKVVDLLEFPNCLYLVYEYVDGKLLSKIDNVSTSEKKLAEISSQIMLGLLELHNKGIVHTILNEDSIIRTDRGEYKIIKLSYSHSGSNDSVSTIQTQVVIYPPEFDTKDPRTVNPLFDVWSLGLLIYKLSQKADAFPTARALHQYTTTMKFPKFEGSTNLNNLLQNCLNPDPDKRMTILELLGHEFITCNTKSQMIDTKGIDSKISSARTNINDPNYITSIIKYYQEQLGEITTEIEKYRKEKDIPIKALDQQIAQIDREILEIKTAISKIKQYNVPNEADLMTGPEVQYFNTLTKGEVFKGNSVQNGYIQPDKRITLNVDSRNPTKYDWDKLAKCFQKLRAAAIENNKGFILAIPKDYIFDLDEFEEIALPLIKDTLHTGVNRPVITIEFYSVLSDEQVDYVTDILGPYNFFIKFKKDRISFFSQLNVASYKQSHPDSCLCTFEVF